VTIVVNGSELTAEQVVRVARDAEGASIDPASLQRMASSRAIVDRAWERGDHVYGLTTGVGADKRRRVGPDDERSNAWSLVRAHLVAQGPAMAPDVVRAAMLVLVNGFASGTAGVRPELATRVLEALNNGPTPLVRSLGSVGQADLAPLAELASRAFSGIELAPGEGLALLSSNAFATGAAALAISDAGLLLDAMDGAGALSLEGFGANLGMLHPAVAATRPYEGVRTSLERQRHLLRGSRLWEAGAARNLQDPLTFRSLPQVHGAARDGFAFAAKQLAVELNASQSNPIVVVEEDGPISVANFDSVPLASALDVLRIALAPAVGSSIERVVKLLDAPWSGLPRGLVDGGGAGLSYLAIAGQAIAAEARLLAGPVSFELVSTAHAEGIEDRTSLTPLAARRTAEMVGLGTRIVATELVVATQAVELRGSAPIGRGVDHIRALIRDIVPFMEAGDDAPPDPEVVTGLVRSGLRSVLP
jgi:histidine ammonia-lyase